MTATTTVAKLLQHEGDKVQIRGWLQNRRSKGKIQFLQIRDGSGTVQCIVLKNAFPEELFAQLDALPYESALTATGQVRADDRAPGGVEMELDTVEIVSVATDEYPISNQAHGADHLLSNRHLWLRSKRQHAIMRVRDEVMRAIRDFFHERDFVNVDAPIFTPNACEGTSNLFEVDYFDEKVYLSQSGQLYMEAAAMALGKVYCFGPTFRAEKSKTRRHLTEFWMIEPEMAYCTFDEVMDLSEDFVRFIIDRVLTHRQIELSTLERDVAPLEKIRETKFARVSYDDAVKFLQDKGHEIEWGADFGAPDETALGEHYATPVLVHGWPKEIKAFYMKEDPNDPRLAQGVDMIAPEGYGEIIGGGQREDSLEVLQRKIGEHGLPEEAFAWYLDLRRYGSVPHGGFGLGLERTVSWLCGIEHLREAIPFPRMISRTYP